jgi:hypothetical protein
VEVPAERSRVAASARGVDVVHVDDEGSLLAGEAVDGQAVGVVAEDEDSFHCMIGTDSGYALEAIRSQGRQFTTMSMLRRGTSLTGNVRVDTETVVKGALWVRK